AAARRWLLDFVVDLYRMGREPRIFRHSLVPEDAASVEDEHGAFRDPFETDASASVVLHPIGPAHGPVPIAQERIIEMFLFLEDPVAVMAVRADPEHLRTHRLEVAHGISEGAQLSLARVREVEDVER